MVVVGVIEELQRGESERERDRLVKLTRVASSSLIISVFINSKV